MNNEDNPMKMDHVMDEFDQRSMRIEKEVAEHERALEELKKARAILSDEQYHELLTQYQQSLNGVLSLRDFMYWVETLPPGDREAALELYVEKGIPSEILAHRTPEDDTFVDGPDTIQ